jgi:membrane fusion protein
MSGLFRPEVIEGRQQAWLGNIQLIRPVPLAMLTGLVAVAAICVATYLMLGEYTRKARVTGYLVPDGGVIRLVPPQAARVVESSALEGKTVRKGDVLFVLSLDRTTQSGDTQDAVRASLAARAKSLEAAGRQKSVLQQAQLSSLDTQLADVRGELRQLATEADLHSQRLALAQAAQARLESLRNDNFVSQAHVQAKAEELLGLRAQLQSLDRQRAALQRQLSALESQKRELPLRTEAEQGQIERDLAELQQEAAESEARHQLVVRAPNDGVITAVTAQPGQPVTPGTSMASLVPSGATMQAHLFAPSSAVGFVKAQQTVLLRYQAFPYQKFGHQHGQVLQVSRTPMSAHELGTGPAETAAEPLYRITVVLDRQSVKAYGQAQTLTPGMRLEADVLLDRRRLIEWLFEPVLSIAGRV